MTRALDEAKLRRAVEERVARDFQTLNPAAQQRYRAALRAQMRDAQRGPSLNVAADAADVGVALLAMTSVVLVAIALGLLAAAMLGGVALAVIIGARRREGQDHALPQEAGGLGAERVMALHLAAMAQSRRAYYLHESAAGAQQSQRIV